VTVGIQISRILCPLDFSEGSEHALRYAKALAQAYAAELLLMHVVETPAIYLYPDVGIPAGALEKQRATCAGRLTGITAAVREEHPNTHGLLTDGNPCVLIAEAAKTHETDLIVMGTHGRTGLAHALLGSVAETVVRKAPCPVLTIKLQVHEFVVL
jgi:nucleotide-binding universal stress UspA family protein